MGKGLPNENVFSKVFVDTSKRLRMARSWHRTAFFPLREKVM